MNPTLYVSKLYLEGTPFHNHWYVCRLRFTATQRWNYSEYLHSDLKWNQITHDGKGKYCYFKTKKEAINLLERWKATVINA